MFRVHSFGIRMLLLVTCLILATLMPMESTADDPNPIRITSILGSPYLMLRSNSDGPNEPRFEGFCVDLIENLAKIVGFNYTINVVKDSRYGVRLENGTWNGIIGELVRREADMAVAPLTITSQRERVVDFSRPFMSVGLSMMILKPSKLEPGVFVFLQPFSCEVWLSIVAASIIVCLLTFAIARWVPTVQQQASEAAETTTKSGPCSSLWYSPKILFQQGTNNNPRSISSRVLSAFWCSFIFIVIATYTANLVAFVLAGNGGDKLIVPVQSPEDLIKQTEIQYGTIESGSTSMFFKTSKIPTYERIWNSMSNADPTVFVKTAEEGVQRVRNSRGKYVFFLESTMNEYYNQRKPCNTMKVGPLINSVGYGLAFPLQSQLRDRATLAILELQENGKLSQLRNKWWSEKGECGSTATSPENRPSFQFGSTTLTGVLGAFYLLIFGIILTLLVATLEYCYQRRQRANTEKKTEQTKDGEEVTLA